MIYAIQAKAGVVYRLSGQKPKIKILKNRYEDGTECLNTYAEIEGHREPLLISNMTELEELPQDDQSMISVKAEAFKAFKEKFKIKKDAPKIHIINGREALCKASGVSDSQLFAVDEFMKRTEVVGITFCSNCRKFHYARIRRGEYEA